MGERKSGLNCKKGITIEKINKHWNYEDDYPGGEGDSKLVSCGQQDGYNELEYILRKLIKHKGNSNNSEDELIQALCECCNELESPRDRSDFYRCLKKKTGIDLNK